MRKDKYLKYIPTYCLKSVLDVDYNKLYELGKRIILTDLDNTLISYNYNYATKELICLNDLLREKGFKIFIVSNNNEKRIVKFMETFKIDGYLIKAGKPSAKKINMFINNNNFSKNEIIFIGDQLVTDVACANNVGIDSILVSTIDVNSQKWYTKINRMREARIIKNISKINFKKACEIYETVKRGTENE